MNDQNPTPTPGQSTPPPASTDWREQRRAERMARHEERWQRHGSLRRTWIWGLILVFLGVALLLENLHIALLTNWWALFILIPGIGMLVTTYQAWIKNDRRFTAASRGPLIGALALLGVTAVFLFNLDWGRVWPLFLILAGLAVLLSSFQRKS